MTSDWKPKNMKYWKKHEQLLKKLYWEDGMAMRAVADKYGVSNTYMRKVFIELGIEVRPNRILRHPEKRAEMDKMLAELKENRNGN